MIFELKVARRLEDGSIPIRAGFFPKTVKKYPFFSREKPYKWIENVCHDHPLIELQLEDTMEDSLNGLDKKFADIHYNKYAIASYLIISREFKELLQQFKIIEHRFYPVNLFGLNEIRQYHIFHLVDPWRFLDYTKCQFGIYNRGGSNIGFTEIFPVNYIKDKIHLENFKSKYLEEYYKSPEKYILGRKKRDVIVRKDVLPFRVVFNNHFDIITPIDHLVVLINEKVKQAIESSDLTGWEITPYDNKDFKIEIPENI